MSLYDLVFYVVHKLFGYATYMSNGVVINTYLLYPLRTGNIGDITLASSTSTYFSVFRSIDSTQNFWWQFLSDPKLVTSTVLYLLCLLITVELCLILPFRAFKRLVRYPNRNLMTPGEYRRSKRR